MPPTEEPPQPPAAAAAAAASKQITTLGKLSGVTIGVDKALLQTNPTMSDFRPVFEAAAKAAAQAEQSDNPAAEARDDDNVSAAAVSAANHKKQIRFSLGGGSQPGEDDERRLSAGRILSKFARQRLSSSNARPSMSPSELSKVSTAPPSEAGDDDDDVEDPGLVEQVRGAGVEEEPVEEDVAALQQQPQADASPAAMDDPPADDSFPLPDDPDDDDADLVPPPPPPEEEEQEENVDDHNLHDNDDTEFPTSFDDDDMGGFDDDDDDKEGTGYQMAGTADDDMDDDNSSMAADKEMKATLSPEEEIAAKKKTTKKKGKKETAKSKNKRSRAAVDESIEEDSDDEESAPPPKKKKRAAKKKKPLNNWSPKGLQSGPLEYEAVPVTDLKHAPTPGLRRSTRARIQPLQFWKGETYQWIANDMPNCPDSLANMPVPVAITKAKPTPYKKKKVAAAPAALKADKKKAGKKKKNVSFDESVMEHEVAPQASPFDSSKLRKKFTYLDEEANVWDDTIDSPAVLKVVSRDSHTVFRALPLGDTRKKSEGKVVGKAGSAFNVLGDKHGDYVGYIMGGLTLPPRGIKDAESVGACAQTFTVVSGQDGALEVAYGDPDEINGTLNPSTAHRFLLSPRDVFRIPPGNCYRLQNHSKSAECFLTWTIIRSVENTASVNNDETSATSSSQSNRVPEDEERNAEEVASSSSPRTRRSRRRR